MNVDLYTTPACHITKRHLDRHAVPYTEHDPTTDPGTLAYVRDTLGHHAAPVIVITHDDGETEDWSGYRPDRLNTLTPHTASQVPGDRTAARGCLTNLTQLQAPCD